MKQELTCLREKEGQFSAEPSREAGTRSTIWICPAETTNKRNQAASLLESTTLIAKITHFLNLPKINSKDIEKLDDLLLSYWKCLQKYWPSEPSHPNLHLTQHYPAVIRLFGPPQSMAAWAQEQVNGILQKLLTNHHPGQWALFIWMWTKKESQLIKK